MSPRKQPDRPVITLDQLAAQLKRYEGQVILNGPGLALTIMMAAVTEAEQGGQS